ncbi:hypothetical protein ACHAWF_009162 [Thalassiosira exigua]
MQSSPHLEAEKRRGVADGDAGVGARVAFLGNSILYYNDTPRFLVNLGQGAIEHQDSCLRGGTNLVQLWTLGNGMRKHGFATEAARIGNSLEGNDAYDVGAPNVKALLACGEGRERWDCVVFNDHTQGPARSSSRDATRSILLERYLPLILENEATPIIVETAAYRYPEINNSKDLGSTYEFQRRVKEGVESYVEALRSGLPSSLSPRMAPVGTAYLRVREENRPLWEELFDPHDHFHPSPIGTFLQGCVLHCIIFGTSPPLPGTEEEIRALWKNARMMHNVKTGNDRCLPTVHEAEYLWNVANDICA